MPKQAQQDEVKWEYCHCGCGGDETVYKGRQFWLSQIAGSGDYFLFHGHGYQGFHVGDHRFKSVCVANQAVRENYMKYPRMKPLNWHPCSCGQGFLHDTVCHKGIRFKMKWDGFRRRCVLFTGHSKKVHGYYKPKVLDELIRRMARMPRGSRKKATTL